MSEIKKVSSSTEDAAMEKFKKYKSIDPFPDIKEALLNSADIHSYVNATGMIHPFDEKELKSASYAAKIAGECRYWDEENNKFENIILEKDGDKLILKPNSIAFVGIEPTFRLPDYIALRFNLKITHVYRGLLLGTGPLIDPGFEGKITIPLHNLTSNEYVFSFRETLIWIEFTKTSSLPNAKKIEESQKNELQTLRSNKYIPFPDDKKYKPLNYYLNKALKGTSYKGVISSIPSTMFETKEYANNANISAKEAKKNVETIRNWSIGAAIALLIGVAALVYNSWSLQRDYFEQAINKIDRVDKEIKNDQKDMLNTINKFIDEQNNKIIFLQNEIELLSKKNNLPIDNKTGNTSQNNLPK